MKVALISRAASPFHGHGGLERHVAAVFEYLRRAGCDVTLFTSPPRDAQRAPEGVHFVPYRVVPWPKRRGFVVLDRDTNYLAWSLSAGKLAHGQGFDLVQADGGAAFGFAFAADASSPPLVLHPHGMEEFKAPTLKRTAYLPLRAATRFAARRAAAVLAPDAAMRDEVTRYLGVDGDEVVVMPNALDLEAVDAVAAAVAAGDIARFAIPDRAPVLLSVGRIEANKGFDVLTRALAGMADVDFTWVLVGEGPRRGALERALDEARLRPRVVLTGPVTDEELASLFRRARLFVHPTLFEGSSMVTLEAMAHRTPVVASAVGGIPDKVVDGESGRLVPPGDAGALAAALRDALARDEATLDAWGARGRSIVEARFDWTKRSKELVALYERLIARRSR